MSNKLSLKVNYLTTAPLEATKASSVCKCDAFTNQFARGFPNKPTTKDSHMWTSAGLTDT